MTWQTSKVQLFDVEVRIKTFMMEKLNMRWLFLWPVLKPVLVYVLKFPKSWPNIDDSYGTYLFCPQKIEKTTPKSCILMAVGRVFFLCSTVIWMSVHDLHVFGPESAVSEDAPQFYLWGNYIYPYWYWRTKITMIRLPGVKLQIWLMVFKWPLWPLNLNRRLFPLNWLHMIPTRGKNS